MNQGVVCYTDTQPGKLTSPCNGSRTSFEIMIKLLAKFFRGVHFIIGVSAPPPGQNERSFVLMWLGILAFLATFGALLTYLVPYLYFKR